MKPRILEVFLCLRKKKKDDKEAKGLDLNNEALKTVTESFDSAKEARSTYESLWNECFKLSKSIPGKVKYKWMTNRFVPYTATLIDLIFPRLAARRPAASVSGRTERAAMNQDKFNQLIEYEQDLMNVDVIFSHWIYDGIRYGTSFLKIGWKKETADNLPRTKSFIDKILNYFKTRLGMTVKMDDLLYDGPTLSHPDIFEIFVHPKATCPEDALFIIERSEVTSYDLRKNPNFKEEDIKDLKYSNTEIDEFRKNRLQEMGMSSSQARKISEKMADSYHELLEYWGLFDFDGDGIEEECHICVINREKVILMEENPFYHGKKPYVVFKYRSEPHFFYGEGVPERVKSLQYELNDTANQASDVRKLVEFPIIKFKKSANLDVESLKIAPGMPIPLDSPSDLVFERPDGSFLPNLENYAKAVRELMQIATGANDVIIGQSDTGIASQTLGGMQIAQEQSTLRFKTPSLNLDSAIEDYGNLLIALNQQYHDRKKEVPIKTSTGITYGIIGPKDLSGQFSYKVQTNSMTPVSNSVRQGQLLNLKEIFMGDPTKDMSKIDRLLIETFDIDPDTVEQPSPQSTDALNQFKQLPPEQQMAYISKLPPQDQELMKKAIGISNETGVPTNSTNVTATGVGNTQG